MITGLYAGILALIFVGLSVYVIIGRRQFGVGLGDGENQIMRRRIRAQGNFSEYAPMFLILFGISEFNHLPALMLHGFGLLFLCGRICHAYSLLVAERYENSKLLSNPVWRIRGMMLTFACIGGLAVISVAQYLIGLLH